jgi:hypothetical protein
MKEQLGFNLSDADTIAASDYVAAGVFDQSKNGIDSKSLSAARWLNTASALYSGDGATAISATGTSLDVNLTNTIPVDLNGVYDAGTNPTPDNVGMIAHVRNAAPGDPQQTFRSTGGAASSDNVVAANVFGLDVNSFLMGYDGATWDRVTATAGALDVNIKSQTLSPVVVSDAALANTAYAAEANPINDVEENLIATPLANRKYLHTQNNDNKHYEIINTGGTYGSGFPIKAGTSHMWRAGGSIVFKAIAPSGATVDARNLQLS